MQADDGTGEDTQAGASGAADWEALGLATYEAVVARLAGFRAREGQRAMVHEASRVFAHGELGETPDEPERAIAVVQAGTGVGKSAAYSTAGTAIAKARGARLLIATSTVALQSQLMEKDLPALSAASPIPFSFALAKGRGRYVCKDKLLRHALIDTAAQDLLDFGDTIALPGTAAQAEARVQLYRRLADAVDKGWDGDRDSLDAPPAPEDWAPVAAERHTCTVKACQHFDDCAYYRVRRKLAQVDVIVTNQDLLLASMNARILPELSDCLLVIDEAHHLPAKAVEQFAARLELDRLRWLDRLPKALATVSAELETSLPPDIDTTLRSMREALHALSRLVLDRFGAEIDEAGGVRRLAEIEVHELLAEPLKAVAAGAAALMAAAGAQGAALKERMREQPGATRLQALYTALGASMPPLAAALESTERLLTEGEDARRTAKWCSFDPLGTALGISLHACPILPGELLRRQLWSRVRSAVLTSATLTSCGSFDWFLREAGLRGDPAVRAVAVPSPFDHAAQGALVVQRTCAAPRDFNAYNAEVAVRLAQAVDALGSGGGLALFTSRRHLQQAVDAITDLDPALQARILVQGTQPRGALVAEHARRVRAGQPSVLLGLASFGEGLDLPGDLCRHLWIMRLPFGSPDDPVAEARAEFVEAAGGNAFADLVVPQAGVRLLQWTGRGIRTETDTARITVFDSRLVDQAYGRRLLAGLPPYPVQVVPAG